MPTFIQRRDFGAATIRNYKETTTSGSGTYSATPLNGSVIVGGSGFLSDGTDATYARLVARNNAPAYNRDIIDFLSVAGFQTFPPPRPPEVPSYATRGAPAFRIRIRVGATDAGGGTSSGSTLVGAGPNVDPTVFNSANYIFESGEPGGVLQYAAVPFPPAGTSGTYGYVLPTPPAQPSGDPTSYEVFVYQAWVVYGWTWTDPAKPITRRYPRDDGRGMSSAPRLFPPSRSARMVGGYQ